MLRVYGCELIQVTPLSPLSFSPSFPFSLSLHLSPSACPSSPP